MVRVLLSILIGVLAAPAYARPFPMNGLRPDVGAGFGASYDRSGFAVNTPWLTFSSPGGPSTVPPPAALASM